MQKKQILAEIGHVGKNMIENNPALVNIHKQNIEWKGCNMCSTQIRRGLIGVEELIKGRNNGRLLSIIKRIQTMGSILEVGKRAIELSRYKDLLVGFNLNSAHPFKEVFFGNPILSISDDRKEVTLNLKNFKSRYQLKWTEFIKQYRVYLSINEVSDIRWDSHERYCSTQYGSSLYENTTISEWYDTSSDETELRLSVSFPENYVAKESTTVVVTMGLEFASSGNGKTVITVKDRGTCAIVGCF